jgi:hypothetical protein
MRNKMTRRVVQTEKLQICLHGVAWRCPSFRQVVESHVIQTGLFMPCSCCHCNFVCCIHCVVRHNYTFRKVVHRIPGHVDKVELLFNFCRHALRERCQFLAHIFLEGGSPPPSHLLNLVCIDSFDRDTLRYRVFEDHCRSFETRRNVLVSDVTLFTRIIVKCCWLRYA